jgi:hypothetical protein
LTRAVQYIAGDLTNTFDLNTDNQDGLWLVELTDATGRQPIALATPGCGSKPDALPGRSPNGSTGFSRISSSVGSAKSCGAA